MTERTIPFAGVWRRKMLDGRKWTTARTKRLADEGDTFPAFGATFRVLSVSEIPYGELVREHYASEGCESEDELRTAFRRIWWGKEPREDRILWLYTFARVDVPTQAHDNRIREGPAQPSDTRHSSFLGPSTDQAAGPSPTFSDSVEDD